MDLSAVLALIVDNAEHIITGASIAAAVLRKVLPPLREHANKTATNADDALAEFASLLLAGVVMVGDGVHWLANKAALNPKRNPAPKPEPVEVLIEVDEDKSSDGGL